MEGEREDDALTFPVTRNSPDSHQAGTTRIAVRTPKQGTKKEHQGKVKAMSLVLGRGPRILGDPYSATFFLLDIPFVTFLGRGAGVLFEPVFNDGCLPSASEVFSPKMYAEGMC